MELNDDGEARFFWPDGRPLLGVPAAPRWAGAPLAPATSNLVAEGITIDAHTSTPLWHGERLDLAYAIDVLWQPRSTEAPPRDGSAATHEEAPLPVDDRLRRSAFRGRHRVAG